MERTECSQDALRADEAFGPLPLGRSEGAAGGAGEPSVHVPTGGGPGLPAPSDQAVDLYGDLYNEGGEGETLLRTQLAQVRAAAQPRREAG